jgi:hypothetical protein
MFTAMMNGTVYTWTHLRLEMARRVSLAMYILHR